MTDNLSRYYTEKQISSLLVSSFSLYTPSTILDLGVGGGSLIIEAYKRWCNARFFAIDIDTFPLNELKKLLPRIEVSKIDGLSPDLHKKLNHSCGSVDIAVCNPPYRKLRNTGIYNEILRKAGFNRVLKSLRLTTDIVFLAQNLNLLSPGGELGIILPDTLLSGSAFKHFRADLMTETTISSIIQLPDKIFAKTEALTHILILKKQKPICPYKVALKIASGIGEIKGEVILNSNELPHRMDYKYHSFSALKNIGNSKTLNDIGVKIFRGKHSKKKLVEKLGAENFFHISSFAKSVHNNTTHLKNRKSLNSVAKKGDILVARVGKRSLGQFAIVESGSAEISDCVFVIRVEKKYQNIVFQSLASDLGKTWIKAHAHGVCSQFITQKDLLNFPLFSYT